MKHNMHSRPKPWRLLTVDEPINDHNPRLAQLRARQQRAKALHDQVHNDLERTAVRALAPGKVTAIHVSPGDRVRAGDQLVDVFDTRLIEVRAQIPNRHLPTLRHGLSTGAAITAHSQH
ncbi:MAG: hypothetical protein CM1200mP41_04330 [Gammaproteobacteria bacterium]|nr:MAG: hypothetical protein CM1200mP41_04330 [Gammaproteobacteria bacterium]